jgi:hypothetical protein
VSAAGLVPRPSGIEEDEQWLLAEFPLTCPLVGMPCSDQERDRDRRQISAEKS